jgi:hypothetical protein
MGVLERMTGSDKHARTQCCEPRHPCSSGKPSWPLGNEGRWSSAGCVVVMLLVVGSTMSACSSGQSGSRTGTSTSPTAVSSPVPAGPVASSPDADVTEVTLVWSHVVKVFDESEIWYVARVVNPGAAEASLALDARAVDRSGTIVGSTEQTLPNIPPHSRFDFFGSLGGGLSPLTGNPTTVRLAKSPNAFGSAGSVWAPLLHTARARLTKSRPEDNNTNAKYSYNLSVEVTNSTDQEIGGGVTQQVVLYNASGHVVGGGTGSSDNVPTRLLPGDRYREQWQGIPAVAPAKSVSYSVWPSS